MVTCTDPNRVEGTATDDYAPHYGTTASGYGGKIPTKYWVKYNARWRRVYVMIYSNSGSAYIVVNGKTVFLDSDTEHNLRPY